MQRITAGGAQAVRCAVNRRLVSYDDILHNELSFVCVRPCLSVAHNILVFPLRLCCYRCGGQGAKNSEEQRIGRDVQIKIHKTVKENCDNTGHAAQGYAANSEIWTFQLGKALPE